MIAKEDAVEIAARFLRESGYAINGQEPTCSLAKKFDPLSLRGAPEALEIREQHPQAWDAMVERMAKMFAHDHDRWVLSFTIGEEEDRVWEFIEVEVDSQTGQPTLVR